MNKKNTLVYLLLILAVGAAFRFYGINKRGLFIPDETMYYRAAVATKEAIRGYLKHPGGNFLNILLPAVDSFAGKPLHVLLGLLGLFILGVHQYSPIIITGLYGCLTLWLVFLIGKKFYNETVGLISAMLLSVSAFHVYYSRSFMAHADQAFFITLAVFLYLTRFFKKTKSGLSLAGVGLLLGLAFTIHTVTIFYIPFFIILEAAVCIFEKPVSIKRIFSGIFIFMVSFFAPALIFELISIFGRNESAPLFTFVHKGYFGQVVLLDSGDAIQNGLINNRNLGRWHLISLSGVYNGWLFAVMMALASLIYFLKYVWKKRSFIAFILFMLSSGILIYWQLFARHERQFRLILSAYPVFCVVIAVIINDLFKKRGKAVLIALLLIEGLYCSTKVVREAKSYFSAVEKFLLDNKADKILTTSYYVATTADVLMPDISGSAVNCVSNWTDVKNQTVLAGKAYLMVSPDIWLETDEFHFKSRPALIVPDQFLFYFPTFYETTKFTGRKDYLKRKNDIYARNMAIFDIKDLISEKGNR